MNVKPKRPWWRRRRWIGVMLIYVVLSYPLSFVPACWIMMRLDPMKDQAEFRFLGLLYRPIAIALIESPHPVRNCVYWVTELGAPEGVTFFRDNDRGVVWEYPGGTYTLLWY